MKKNKDLLIEINDQFKEYFDRKSINYGEWFNRSQILNDCAKIIANHIDEVMQTEKDRQGKSLEHLAFNPVLITLLERYSVYLMLKGFAFEVMFKGAYVKKYGKFDNKLKTHNLTKLCDFSGLQRNVSGTLTLDRLEKYLVWAGRYPLPKSHTDYIEGGLPDWSTIWVQLKTSKFNEKLDDLFDSFLTQAFQ